MATFPRNNWSRTTPMPGHRRLHEDPFHHLQRQPVEPHTLDFGLANNKDPSICYYCCRKAYCMLVRIKSSFFSSGFWQKKRGFFLCINKRKQARKGQTKQEGEFYSQCVRGKSEMPDIYGSLPGSTWIISTYHGGRLRWYDNSIQLKSLHERVSILW